MKTKLLLVYRLYNPAYGENGNPQTLTVSLREDNIFCYSLFGGWQNSGTAFAVSNLGLKADKVGSLPLDPKLFETTEKLDFTIRTILMTGYGSNQVKKVEVLNEVMPLFGPMGNISKIAVAEEIVQTLQLKGNVDLFKGILNSSAETIYLVKSVLDKYF